MDNFIVLCYCHKVCHLRSIAIEEFTCSDTRVTTCQLYIFIPFNLSFEYVQDENILSLSQCRIESSSNLSGRSLRNMMLRSRTFSEGKLR